MVNPYEMDQVVEAISDAIEMKKSEMMDRSQADMTFITSNPPSTWAKCVLDDIVSARKRPSDFRYMGTGFGLNFRVLQVDASFQVSGCNLKCEV